MKTKVAESYLHLTFIILCGLLLSVYYMILAEPYLYEGILAVWKYHGIIPVTFLYLTCLLIVGQNNNIISEHVSIPSVLFLLFMGYFIYLGTIDHYLQSVTGAEFVYVDSINTCYNYYISISLVSWVVGYLFGSKIIGRITLSSTSGQSLQHSRVRNWDKRRLYLMNLFWGVVGIAAFTIFYAFCVK